MKKHEQPVETAAPEQPYRLLSGMPILTDEMLVEVCNARGWNIDDAPSFRQVAHAFYAEGFHAKFPTPVQPEAAQDERERFERFVKASVVLGLQHIYPVANRRGGEYLHNGLNDAWIGWQAAKRDAAQAPQEWINEQRKKWQSLDCSFNADRAGLHTFHVDAFEAGLELAADWHLLVIWLGCMFDFDTLGSIDEVAASAAARRDAITKSKKLVDQENARFAIEGAIEYGRRNINPPPADDHWLAPFWNIGRQLAAPQERAAVTDAKILDVAAVFGMDVGDVYEFSEKQLIGMGRALLSLSAQSSEREG